MNDRYLVSNQRCHFHTYQWGTMQSHPGWTYEGFQWYTVCKWWYVTIYYSQISAVIVPEVKGGSIHNDITGQRKGFCCKQHSQWKIEGSEKGQIKNKQRYEVKKHTTQFLLLQHSQSIYRVNAKCYCCAVISGSHVGLQWTRSTCICNNLYTVVQNVFGQGGNNYSLPVVNCTGGQVCM